MRPAALLLLLFAAASYGDPVSSNEAGLAALQDGRASAAVAHFESALREQAGDPVLRRNLAAALAALAQERRKAGRPGDAVALLDRAVALHPERLRYRLLRGRSRFEEEGPGHRFHAAADFAAVLDGDPDHVDALVNLGQIDYLERRLADAVARFRRAFELRPDDADVASRLRKAERELAVEERYEELATPAVLVRYGPSIPRATAEDALGFFEEAYARLTAAFRHWPESRTVVTLYPPREFQAATQVHGWVAGLSDGTIRLTVRPGTSRDALRATIRHELTHHLVRAVAPRAPVWLHEGLAQLAEEKSVAQAEARLRRTAPLDAGLLDRVILSEADPGKVSRFYDLALAFTSYLRELRGDAGIQELLRGLGGSADADAVMRDVHGGTRDELFARWRARLREG